MLDVMENPFSKLVISTHYVLLHVFIVVSVIVGAVALDDPYHNSWILGAILGLVVGVIITGVMFVQLQIAQNTIRVRNNLGRIITLLEEKTDQKPLAPDDPPTIFVNREERKPSEPKL